jgi:heme exporter protein D
MVDDVAPGTDDFENGRTFDYLGHAVSITVDDRWFYLLLWLDPFASCQSSGAASRAQCPVGSTVARGAGAVMTDFFTMGGYGAYVWASYGVTLFVLGALPLRALACLNKTYADLAASQGPGESDVRLTVRRIE